MISGFADRLWRHGVERFCCYCFICCFPKLMDQWSKNHDGRAGRGAKIQHMQNCTADEQSPDNKLIY